MNHLKNAFLKSNIVQNVQHGVEDLQHPNQIVMANVPDLGEIHNNKIEL